MIFLLLKWNKQRWHVILRVCKWLGLKKLRCQTLQYVYNQGDLMFHNHAKKDLDEQDWQILFVLSNGMDPRLEIDNILDGTYDDNQSSEFIQENFNDLNINDIKMEGEANCMIIKQNNHSPDNPDNEDDQSMEILTYDYEKLYDKCGI